MRELRRKEAPTANSWERRLRIRRGPGCLWARGGVILGTKERPRLSGRKTGHMQARTTINIPTLQSRLCDLDHDA
jgi:hypothetical protein